MDSMDLAGTGSVEDSSSHLELPDLDVLEIDPTCRYIRYNDVLGKGAFKTVYKAFDQINGIEVAWNQIQIDEVLKLPKGLERLYSEVQLLNSLKHNNIIKLYNSWIDDHKMTANIITELCTSGSLRQYHKKHKKVDMKAVKGWARQILMGLNYLHSQNPPIIHRDLKCDNIFINGNYGEVKIGDLGLAIVIQQANVQSVNGTPEFMAPELYDEDYNELVDIYSFGMCMLEMVTFEYPYSECRTSLQIYKKVSSGIKPAALSKVKDVEVKLFIEKCLVPAAQRLSAKELLKDPFLLQVDGFPVNGSLQLPGIVEPNKMGAFRDRCVLSDEPRKQPMLMSMDIDRDGEPPVTTFCENSVNGGPHFVCPEVQRANRGNDFRLEGETDVGNSVSLLIPITDQNGDVRHTDFQFYLDRDTAVSVAGEMVEQLGLADKNVMFIAEMIDLLLINLFRNWKPCVPIDHLENLNGGIQSPKDRSKDSQLREHTEISFGSFHNVSSSVEESLLQMHESSNYEKLDDIMSHADFGTRNTDIVDNRGSEMSIISAISTDGNYKKCSITTCMCGDSGYIATSLDNRDTGINNGSSDMRTLSSFPSNVSSVVLADQDDGEELRLELELIEMQYQQAIKEIFVKRHEAILAAKRRLSQKNMISHH